MGDLANWELAAERSPSVGDANWNGGEFRKARIGKIPLSTTDANLIIGMEGRI